MVTSFKRISYVGGIIPTLIGCLTLLGYVIHNQALKSILSEFVAMNPATAISFIFGGISLFLLNRETTNTMLLRIGLMFTVLIALVGFVKLGGILVAHDIYIDSHLFIEQLNTEALTTGRPNSMAPTTAISFFFIGISLFLLYKNKKEWLAQLLSLATFFLAFLAIAGYLYGVRNLIGFANYIPMAVNTAIAFMALSLGILFLHSNREVMFIFTSENAGGILVRKLIPVAILAPTLLGYLGLVAERAGIFTNELGLSLIIVANIIIFTAFIWWIANILNDVSKKLKESQMTLEQKVRDRTQDFKNASIAAQNVLEDLSIEKSKVEIAKAKDEALLQSIGDGIIATDSNRRIIVMNKMAEKLLGWKVNEVIGKLYDDIVLLEDEKGTFVPLKERPLYKAFNNRTTTTTTTSTVLYLVSKNRTKFPVAITVSPIIIDNKVIGAVEVFRDITKEQEVDKAKTEFISLASHQLRTPLTTISWYTEMLLKSDMGKVISSQKKYLEEIYESNQRMIKLVNTLLNVSRLELGTLTTKPEPLQLEKVAESVFIELKPQIIAKRLTIDKNYGPSLPIISADQQSTRMIFQNLLGNAVKYVEVNGKIRIDIYTEGSNLLIKVWNNGEMIPKESQGKIFTKLFRDDWAKQKDPEGSGLGLYIVKSIVENSDGKIRFESEEKGTTFYVTFPMNKIKKEEGLK